MQKALARTDPTFLYCSLLYGPRAQAQSPHTDPEYLGNNLVSVARVCSSSDISPVVELRPLAWGVSEAETASFPRVRVRYFADSACLVSDVVRRRLNLDSESGSSCHVEMLGQSFWAWHVLLLMPSVMFHLECELRVRIRELRNATLDLDLGTASLTSR